jgi:hypothetical protein
LFWRKIRPKTQSLIDLLGKCYIVPDSAGLCSKQNNTCPFLRMHEQLFGGSFYWELYMEGIFAIPWDTAPGHLSQSGIQPTGCPGVCGDCLAQNFYSKVRVSCWVKHIFVFDVYRGELLSRKRKKLKRHKGRNHKIIRVQGATNKPQLWGWKEICSESGKELVGWQNRGRSQERLCHHGHSGSQSFLAVSPLTCTVLPDFKLGSYIHMKAFDLEKLWPMSYNPLPPKREVLLNFLRKLPLLTWPQSHWASRQQRLRSEALLSPFANCSTLGKVL